MDWSINYPQAKKNNYATSEMPEPWEILTVCLISLCVIGISFIVFYLFKNLDYATSSRFVDATGEFYLKGDPYLTRIRRFLLSMVVIAYVLIFIFGMYAYANQKRVMGWSWDKWAYLGACGFFGSYVMVKVILKTYWGRARPRDIVEFAGNLNYTDFWSLSGVCVDSCSFVAGEASALAMLIFSLAFLVGTKSRSILIFFGLLITAVVAWIRMAMGAHFLSDAIIGAALVMIIATEFYYLFFLTNGEWITNFSEKQKGEIKRYF